MRTIRTSTGADITLDGDLLAIMETLYKEITARKALERSFEDMVREIQHLIGQMTDEELRSYLAESLFLNTVKYRTTGSRRTSEDSRRLNDRLRWTRTRDKGRRTRDD